jgi:segregation and condensation protein B
MSLKAKLEAVIYAAEEPVTMAQLAANFAADALEWKAAQEAASAALEAESADQTGANSETLFLLPPPPAHEQLIYMGLDEALAVVLPAESFAAPPEPPVESPAEPNAEPASDASTEAGADASEASGDAELEARRAARLRDREVRAVLRLLLDELIASYASDERGIEIREIAGGFRMATKPECHDAVRSFVKSLKPALRLSLPALETLAVIAYKQPVTAPEVNEIRGVDSSAVFGSLLARKLIVTAGRKPVIGRPILYKTTREFLLRFGLKDVSELPSMEEFEKLAAIELDETEASAGSEPTSSVTSDSNFDSSLEAEEAGDEEPPAQLQNFAAEAPEPTQTAVTAAGNEPQIPEEVAPAAPPATEQAEFESLPHGKEKDQQAQ